MFIAINSCFYHEPMNVLETFYVFTLENYDHWLSHGDKQNKLREMFMSMV